MTTNRFSVPLFWYCFLSLALNIYIYIHLSSSGSLPLPTLFSLFYLREQWDMCLCCIFLSLFWLSLCKIFFIYFLSCPIVINYIVKKKKKKIDSQNSKVTEFGRVFVYLKCKSVGYWYIVVICQNQLIIFIHARSATIADYSSMNCLLQKLVFLAKIEILSIVSGSKNSKLDIF